MKGPESGLEAAENKESHEGFWEEVRVDGSCSQEVMYQAEIHHMDAERGRSQQTTALVIPRGRGWQQKEYKRG